MAETSQQATKQLRDAELLTANPSAPVLLVDGAKAFRAAVPLVPEGWLVTTWEGAVRNTDWAPLAGHVVVIWPPATAKGYARAHEIGMLLQDPVVIDKPPPGAPEDWDLTHEIGGTLTPQSIEAFLDASAQPRTPASAPAPYLNGHDVTPPVAAPPDAPKLLYKPLGHADQKYYFLCGHTQEIVSFISRDLRSGNAAMDLVPDELYWARLSSTKTGVDWKAIGNDLLRECSKKGRWSFERQRGRGVWLDSKAGANRIVTHLGDQVWVDGVKSCPMEVDSRYIYQLSDPILEIADVPELTDAEGQALVAVCRKPQWSKKLSGELLAGIIATSVICATIKFRTHAWVTGPSGSGKSWILQEICARALGTIALNVIGNSSEAGIRQATSTDCRPVIYDEAEGHGRAGRERRELIIQLMRAASASAEGEILKGGSTHKSQGFRVKTQFILGSIGVGIRQQADETRVLVLTLESQASGSKDDRENQTGHFAQLQEMVNDLPANLPERLLRRMTRLVPVVQANAERMRVIIARDHANSRIGDQVGTVLAGCAALTSDRILTDEEIIEILKPYPWHTHQQIIKDGDDRALLRYLAAQTLRVETKERVLTRTVADCALICAGSPDDMVEARFADEALRRHGLRFEFMDTDADGHRQPAEPGVWVANTHDQLDRLMERSPYPDAYTRILERVKGQRKSKKPLRFAGEQIRATWIPLSSVTGDMEDGDGEPAQPQPVEEQTVLI